MKKKDILSPFKIKVVPIDNHDITKTFSDDSGDLNRLNMPKYTYQEMIKNIIQDIKNRDKFKI